jgi:hypothetical protein
VAVSPGRRKPDVRAAARKPRARTQAGRKPGRGRPRSKTQSRAGGVGLEIGQLESLRAEIDGLARRAGPPRWNANPDDVQRSVMKLVLTLVELVRQLLERQAIRRMEGGTISAEETEAIGLALMRLEQTVRDLGAQFDLSPEDLNLDLGPIGKLL